MRADRLRLTTTDASKLFWSYLKAKTAEQIRVVLPLVLLLLFFQVGVLGMKPTAAAATAAGVILVIMGLAFFLEGIRLSIMPLGEEVGLHLPLRAGLLLSLVFGLVVGVGATLAEPAIIVLRSLGASLAAWDAPLLYALLNRYTSYLVAAIGVGVGVAVVLSLIRSFFVWSLKPMIIVLVPVVLGVTVWSYFDPNLRLIAGLAWDAGGVTTGPVTVPLIVSLGLGVSRALKREESATSGLGVVTLASLVPVLAVMLLGIALRPTVPEPMGKAEFFSIERRSEVVELFETQGDFRAYARREGVTIRTPAEGASDAQPESEPGAAMDPAAVDEPAAGESSSRLGREARDAARSIVPLVVMLMFILAVLLRRSVRHWDEVFLGIGVALIGMVMLNVGIQEGLSRLGRGVGTRLPATFQSITLGDEREALDGFDPDIVQRAISPDGGTYQYFMLREDGRNREVPYSPDSYDPETETYEYLPHVGPLVAPTALGIAIVLLFAWLTGFTATSAEPALSVLGGVVEEVTAGAFRRSWLIRIVGSGVGIGMAVGILKVVFDVPILWILGPSYLLLVVLTLVSTEEFVNIAWDSAGVTTGPVTVPLIIAIGLGLADRVGATEGFGIISLASAFPIIAVLLAGLVVGRRERMAMGGTE